MFAVFLFLYYEIIFRISTGTGPDGVSLLISVLFSLSYGAFLALILRPSSDTKINRIITGAALFIIPAVYLIEYFVYRSFNVFYDLNTVFNGAGGAITGFGADILRLVFCFKGIVLIILFFMPFILYLVIGHKKLPMERFSIPAGTGLFIAGFALFFAARGIVNISDIYSPMYEEEYNYLNVVSNLGFATGIRLDAAKLAMGDAGGFDNGGSDFVITASDTPASASAQAGSESGPASGAAADGVLTGQNAPSGPNGKVTGQNVAAAAEPDGDPTGQNCTASSGADEDQTGYNIAADDERTGQDSGSEAPSETETEPTSEPVVYGPNVLDIDFNALAENADGKLKDLDLYVASLTPSMQNEYTGLFNGKNLIFITAEAFSGYLIDPVRTPTLYRLANKGICFKDYYQPAVAGTTGGEYEHLFGMIPTSGGKSMQIMTDMNTSITLANLLSAQGYYGKAYHNNQWTVYNRDETHNRLGYSDGFMGVGNGMEEFLTTSGFPASDLEMMQGTFPTYADRQPFNIYYMTVSGHGQYGRSINQMSSKNYDRVKDLEYSEIVKCYLANNMVLEDALAYLVDELEKRNMADDTVIVMGADHFPYNLDTGASPGNMPHLSELYGFDVNTYLDRDSNALIIWSGCLEKMDPIVVDEPVFSLDILPTLCNLFGVAFDSRLLPGRDVFSDKEALVFDGNYDWKTAYGTYIASRNRFTPASEDIEIPEDYVNQIRIEVRNRMNYCKNVLAYNYFNHVFGTE